ncbi:MAG: SHOCT domain-containing protein [Bacteroidota bacterium]
MRILSIIGYLAAICVFSSCATIVGGSNYNAKVMVRDHRGAKIEYQGQTIGIGEASVRIPRKNADKVVFKISEEGCETQTMSFKKRTFRGWSFVGTLFGWTGIINGIPIPWGIIVDGATGAWWKPDISEKGVLKIDHNHFLYNIDYEGCAMKSKNNQIEKPTIAELLRELKKLLDEGIITQKEYDAEKKKILNREY